MVLKTFTQLARTSISRHIVGSTYSGSVVAATQAHTGTVPFAQRFGQNAPAKINTAFGGANSGGRTTHGANGDGSGTVSNFYAVRDGDDDKEQKKYLFSKKILWSKAQHQTDALTEVNKETDASIRNGPDRDALAKIATDECAIEEDDNISLSSIDTGVDSVLNVQTVENSAVDKELAVLESDSKWAEIEQVFEQRLADGIAPTTGSFNHLLTAAVSKGDSGVDAEVLMTKVINIYTNLLERSLKPDTRTYSTVVDYLAETANERSQVARNIERANDVYSFNGIVPTRVPVSGREVMGMAVNIFYSSTRDGENRQFEISTYQKLVDGCAAFGMVDDMLNVCEQMEVSGVKPTFAVIFSLLRAFSESGDVRSSHEVFSDLVGGEFSFKLTKKELDQAYASMLNAYIVAGEMADGLAFLKQIIASPESNQDTLNLLNWTMVEALARRGDHANAYHWFQKLVDSDIDRITKISSALIAATKTSDHGHSKLWFDLLVQARKDCKSIFMHGRELVDAQMAFLVLNIRMGNLELAQAAWQETKELPKEVPVPAAPVVLYANALIERGDFIQALDVLSFYGISYGFYTKHAASRDYDASSVSGFMESLIRSRMAPPQFVLDAAKAISESGLRYSNQTCEAILSMFNAETIRSINWPGMDFLLKFLAINFRYTPAGPAEVRQMELIVGAAMEFGWVLEANTKSMVATLINSLNVSPEFLNRWTQFNSRRPSVASVAQNSEVAYPETPILPSTVDSVASKSLIRWIDSNKSFNVVMDEFEAIRKSGRTFTTNVYTKVIIRATREFRFDASNQAYAAALADLAPQIPHDPASIALWSPILDAMISSELTANNYDLATHYHNQLKALGGVASANTYGLYIVGIKQSSDIHDEATEAVNVMEQARINGVAASPFLYNAVIGKLAKARRIDDCLFYFNEMRALGLKPTSVTYGTMINALCRVSDDRFAEELFVEMESQPNYKPRPAPYNSVIQHFSTSKRDRSKALAYYNQMLRRGIKPTDHTYKLLIESYAALDPPDLDAAEAVMKEMRAKRHPINSTHYAAVVHAKGCVLHDVDGAIAYFKNVLASGHKPDQTLYQALFESLVANHRVQDTPAYLADMKQRGVPMSPYIANTLIHGWALEKNIARSKEIYDQLGRGSHKKGREPSTYEAMTRAYLVAEDREGAKSVVDEMLTKGYPAAVVGRVVELLKGGFAQAANGFSNGVYDGASYA